MIKSTMFLLMSEFLLATTVMAGTSHSVTLKVTPIASIGAPKNIALPLVDESATTTGHLNYTSIAPSGTTRVITVALVSGVIPVGTILRIKATNGFDTNEGVPSGELILSNTPSPLVYGITSCATSVPTPDGPNVVYTWAVEDLEVFKPEPETTMTIRFELDSSSFDQVIHLLIPE